MKKHYDIKFPIKEIIVYSLLAITSATPVIVLMDETLDYNPSIWIHMTQLIPLVALGGIIYFGLSYLVDESSRNLFKSIISELKGKL